jgi:hypothetical protein
MTLSSALEDVRKTTLSAIEGLLRKLEYLGQLQDAPGRYSHWGVTRVHGESATQRALADAHRNVLSKVLATPISRLVEDLDESSQTAGLSPEAYVERFASKNSAIVPPNPGAGAELHLRSVLHALTSLVKARK